MNKIIYSRFDKAKIAELPRVTFPGRIVTILSAGEAEKAVDFLLKSDILGFDTETRPCFTKGKRNKVALLQVSNREICFLFRLNCIGLAPAIVRLLETEGPLKVGLSWHDDIRSLHERGDFEPHGFIDLQDHMIELGIKDMSLAKLYANLFHQRISKREQLSNWEADVLTDKQKLYGATDAWACVRLYEEYVRLKETNDYFLEFVPEPEPSTSPAANEEKKETDEKPKKKQTKRRKTFTKRKPRVKKEKEEKAPEGEVKSEE
jgi:ribonuclease D